MLWKDEPRSNEQFMDIVKFDSRSGRMSRIDRDPNGGPSVPTEITRHFKAVFDMEHIDVGYVKFAAGMAPDAAWAPWSETMVFPEQPSPEHRRGFRIKIKLHKDCGGDLRELSGNAKALVGGLNDLHNKWLEERAAHPGKVPVVVLGEPTVVTTQNRQGVSTNYAPAFEIVGWANSPPEFKAWVQAPPQAVARPAAPPQTGSTRVAPPVQQAPARAPATVADDEDFG